MATHGIDATAVLGAITLTGHLDSANHNLSREAAEVRVFGGVAVGRVLGLEDCTFTSKGPHDAVTTKALIAAMKAGTSLALVFSPDGGTTTLTTDMQITNVNLASASNGLSTFDLSLAGDGECVVA